jgi:hypothetical protein
VLNLNFKSFLEKELLLAFTVHKINEIPRFLENFTNGIPTAILILCCCDYLSSASVEIDVFRLKQPRIIKAVFLPVSNIKGVA